MGKRTWFRFSKNHNVKIETDDKDFNEKWFIDCGLNGEEKAKRICECINACAYFKTPEQDIKKLIESLRHAKHANESYSRNNPNWKYLWEQIDKVLSLIKE